MTTCIGTPIEVIDCTSSVVPESIYGSDSPVVLKGLVSHWPVVEKGLQSNQSVVEYLNSLYNKQPVNAFMAEPESKGRIFYNEQVDGFNFVQSNVYLDNALNKILEIADAENNPTYYIGSLEINHHLPHFCETNDLALKYANARKSIWLGNQSVVAPHFDFPDNIACCIIGERRFTLFPPEQHDNLYVGPLDLTPAGQPISMVNIDEPDLAMYPKYSEAVAAARSAILTPGDAIYIPSMWWHSVKSLSALNGLVNYWWRETPAYMGAPNNALLHAMLSIKELPERQRKVWQNMFMRYIFEQPDDLYDHLPADCKNKQGQLSEITAQRLRAYLVNKLK